MRLIKELISSRKMEKKFLKMDNKNEINSKLKNLEITIKI